ncbi:hypothetical protein [Salinimonas chungwhensis]|uniref:hypothetical protein n=1 Tax=Salinimonas chungwhensis TaxID=265425 RepID=UPI00036ED851|nr:hypothetical protein [Salinimonas chungwhensis]
MIMTEFENAIKQRENGIRLVVAVIIMTFVLIAALGVTTYQNFDDIYAQRLSAFPTVSAVATLPNVFAAVCLVLVNIAAVSKLRRANQTLALKAYSLLMDSGFSEADPQQEAMKQRFLSAAGLPQNYSLARLAKMKTFHFVNVASPVSRAIHKQRAAWIALSRKVEKEV